MENIATVSPECVDEMICWSCEIICSCVCHDEKKSTFIVAKSFAFVYAHSMEEAKEIARYQLSDTDYYHANLPMTFQLKTEEN